MKVTVGKGCRKGLYPAGIKRIYTNPIYQELHPEERSLVRLSESTVFIFYSGFLALVFFYKYLMSALVRPVNLNLQFYVFCPVRTRLCTMLLQLGKGWSTQQLFVTYIYEQRDLTTRGETLLSFLRTGLTCIFNIKSPKQIIAYAKNKPSKHL